MQMFVHTGLLCIVKILKLFVMTVLGLNMSLTKLKKLFGIKSLKIYIYI